LRKKTNAANGPRNQKINYQRQYNSYHKRKFRNTPSVEQGYAFVVKMEDGKWNFVQHDYGTMLGHTSFPEEVYKDIDPALAEFWHNVVIDGLFHFEDRRVDASTMRLVHVEVKTTECTEALFKDSGLLEQSTRHAALAKLTPEEARALRVESEYSLMCLHRNRSDDALREASKNSEKIQQNVRNLLFIANINSK
jgi:hypothetical protein